MEWGWLVIVALVWLASEAVRGIVMAWVLDRRIASLHAAHASIEAASEHFALREVRETLAGLQRMGARR